MKLKQKSFTKQKGNYIFLVQIYVYDIIFSATNKSFYKDFSLHANAGKIYDVNDGLTYTFSCIAN